jgi:predicted ATPase
MFIMQETLIIFLIELTEHKVRRYWLNQRKRQEEFDENAEEHRKDRMEAAAAAAAVSQTSTAGAKSADAAKS